MTPCLEPIPDGFGMILACLGDDFATCSNATEEDFVDAAWTCLADSCSGFPQYTICEPFAAGDDPCCSWVVFEPGQSCPGRPFLVGDEARVPEPIERGDWATRPTGLGAYTSHERDVLGRAWARDGCHEAASVASFSRFVLQLLALGAPASLVGRAQRAIADELEHASAFFGFASTLRGRPVGPGPLAVEGAMDGQTDPVEIAVALAKEGCIAETISAMQLAAAAERAEDPMVRATLRSIADQELEHAELAWTALAWMLIRAEDPVREAVAAAFAEAATAVPRATSDADGLCARTLRRAGRLSARERLGVAEGALADIIAPAAAQLMTPWTVTAQPASSGSASAMPSSRSTMRRAL